jgi:hypothetical protein
MRGGRRSKWAAHPTHFSPARQSLMVRARHHVAADKALPFEPLVPNAETVEAMRSARRGDVVTVGKPANLLASLNADC